MKITPGLALRLATATARDQTSRRQAISALLTTILGLFALGTFVIDDALANHPLGFVLFWLALGWLTICVLLMAAHDLLMVIRQGRAERASARREIFGEED